MSDGRAVRPPWYGTDRHHCFGCAPDNPAGLALHMVEAGETLTCRFTLTRLHESFPGLVHGGVSAAILDELMGNLLIQRERKVCFLVGLRMTYAGAIRVGRPYSAVAWLSDRPMESPELIAVLGEIRDADGSALVTARGTFHWMSAQEWRQALAPNGEPDADLRPLLRRAT